MTINRQRMLRSAVSHTQSSQVLISFSKELKWPEMNPTKMSGTVLDTAQLFHFQTCQLLLSALDSHFDVTMCTLQI